MRRSRPFRSLELLAACLVWTGFLVTPPAQADDEPIEWDFGWLAFGDAYHIFSHHTDAGDGATGLVLRRAYLTLDGRFNERWDSRARIEINQDGRFEVYEFEAEFKDLWVRRDFGAHELILGLSPTPTFDVIEALWGARYLVRTPMDLQGVASRDLGVAVHGDLVASRAWRYRVMGGTGSEFGAESGDGRKYMGAVSWHPAPGWVVDFYVDYEKLAGPTDRSTAQVFAGQESENWRWGVQYSNQDREEDPPLELASAFLVSDVSARHSLIARVDRIIEPSPAGDNISYLPFDGTAPATMFLGGVEYRPSEHFTLTPNIVYTSYDRNDDGVRPRSDFHVRLTLFANFE